MTQTKKLLRNPKDLAVLQSISLIDFSSVLWSPARTTSFYIDKKRNEEIQKFAKSKSASKSGLISQAVFEYIQTHSDDKFVPCKSDDQRVKASISLPENVIQLIRKYAKENKVTESIVVNTSICSFLNRYK